MEILGGPALVERPAQHTLGIRVETPFRGMLATRDELLDDVFAWLDRHRIPDYGPSYLRLHVIDMAGPMAIGRTGVSG